MQHVSCVLFMSSNKICSISFSDFLVLVTLVNVHYSFIHLIVNSVATSTIIRLQIISPLFAYINVASDYVRLPRLNDNFFPILFIASELVHGYSVRLLITMSPSSKFSDLFWCNFRVTTGAFISPQCIIHVKVQRFTTLLKIFSWSRARDLGACECSNWDRSAFLVSLTKASLCYEQQVAWPPGSAHFCYASSATARLHRLVSTY